MLPTGLRNPEGTSYIFFSFFGIIIYILVHYVVILVLNYRQLLILMVDIRKSGEIYCGRKSEKDILGF